MLRHIRQNENTDRLSVHNTHTHTYTHTYAKTNTTKRMKIQIKFIRGEKKRAQRHFIELKWKVRST